MAASGRARPQDGDRAGRRHTAPSARRGRLAQMPVLGSGADPPAATAAGGAPDSSAGARRGVQRPAGRTKVFRRDRLDALRQLGMEMRGLTAPT